MSQSHIIAHLWLVHAEHCQAFLCKTLIKYIPINYVSQFVLSCLQPSSCSSRYDPHTPFPIKVGAMPQCLSYNLLCLLNCHTQKWLNKVYVMYFNCCNLPVSLSLSWTLTLFVSLFGTLAGLCHLSKNLRCSANIVETLCACTCT